MDHKVIAVLRQCIHDRANDSLKQSTVTDSPPSALRKSTEYSSPETNSGQPLISPAKSVGSEKYESI
jgi:hypothetical protein